MTYEIECYINTINSEGAFSIHGTEGYCLEKGDKTYNVLWGKGKLNKSDVRLPTERKFSLLKNDSQKKFFLLVLAKTNHSKVKLVLDKASDKNVFTIKSMSLI
jgi:hypothetical protein